MRASDRTHSSLVALASSIGRCFARVEPDWSIWEAVEALNAERTREAETETSAFAQPGARLAS